MIVVLVRKTKNISEQEEKKKKNEINYPPLAHFLSCEEKESNQTEVEGECPVLFAFLSQLPSVN